MGRILVLIGAVCMCLPGAAAMAQEFNALARILPQQSRLVQSRGTAELHLGLSKAVPYRVYTLDAPRRVVIDFNEVDFSALPILDTDIAGPVTGLRVGAIAAGWSRMVLDIDRPMAVITAALTVSGDGRAQVDIDLIETDAETFTANAGAPPDAQFPPPARPSASPPLAQRPGSGQALVVVLDPGHGGIDPGAERGGAVEAELMLTFALELKELLLRAGGFRVILTRQRDEFVPLEARVSTARRAQADVFLSLHADALGAGRASGSAVYTLSDTASDIASQKLAERHDRSDLLAGVDLSDQDDVIAGVLMDMARTETAPRSNRLADALVVGLSRTIGMHKRPRLSAGFSVLKAPDIPSVLLELGFLSSKTDRDRLASSKWRAQAAIGIREALRAWALADAANAQLLRK